LSKIKEFEDKEGLDAVLLMDIGRHLTPLDGMPSEDIQANIDKIFPRFLERVELGIKAFTKKEH